jgi:hypothetical protein
MIKDNYLYSTIYDNLADFTPERGSVYLYGHSAEERSYISEELIARFPSEITFIEIKEISHDIIKENYSNNEYHLRDRVSISKFLSLFNATTLYLDSTGLNNRICAALLNNAFSLFSTLNISDIKVIYAEPETYKVVQFSTEGIFHDLSESIDGIEPLPGFASIIPYNENDTCLVALLGFEGGRFVYILEHVESSNVFPVIGVPGFRPEYPFLTYWGNRRPLENGDIWSNIRYASANSIPDVYTLLTKFLKASPSGRLKVSPIGTKPHAIAAILFAIKNPLKVELIYDNPMRVKKRTEGVGKIVECSVYKLLIDK